MLNDQQKQQIAEKVGTLIKLANERYGKPMLPPTILFDCNTSAGGYTLRDTLHFNPTIAFSNFDLYMETTVPHETAHYVQDQVFPSIGCRFKITVFGGMVKKRRSIHGREWQSIMRFFGIRNPKRCHTYDVSNVPGRRVFKRTPVYCSCSVHQVTNKIISKMQQGRTYSCNLCHTRISLSKPLTAAVQSV